MGQKHYAMLADVSNLFDQILLERLICVTVRWAKKEKKERTIPRSNAPGLPQGINNGS